MIEIGQQWLIMTIIGETTVAFYGIIHSWGDLVLITVKMPIAVLSVEELS